MKLASNPLNTRILNSNGKIVRNDGKVYRIVSNILGDSILAQAVLLPKGDTVDLFARTKLAKTLRRLVEMGLVS